MRISMIGGEISVLDDPHVKMFIQCVMSIWPSRVGGTGQYVGMLADDNDIGSVPPSCSFRVITSQD